MDQLFSIAVLEQQLDYATKNKKVKVIITPYQLSVLISAWKNQNYARNRQNVASVTETDQNPA